jgi:hypothetical protein
VLFMNSSKLTALITAMMLVFLSIPVQARIVCWTNKDGVKECGDKVPPEYAQTDRQEMNKQGLVVEEKERAKTEEELAEAKRQAEIQAEKDRLAQEEARRDKILLDTFSSIDDIEMTRDGKIAAIQASISLAEARNQKLQSELDKLVQHAANEERAGKPASEDLVNDIDSLRRQINDNNNFIAEKQKEQDLVREASAKDVERFKELKSIQ